MKAILVTFFWVFCVLTALIFVREFSPYLGEVTAGVLREGFGPSAVKLLILAVFVGWVISRFKKRR